MPVEVKELVIKAVINGEMKKKEKIRPEEKIDREEIIQDCVEQVLEILNRKNER
ncbi:MAG: hypothetical protein JW995_08455 [Melioribacteraceae bacterium]|nr:hypothetical protein [Melioribacteraceae bacterium]